MATKAKKVATPVSKKYQAALDQQKVVEVLTNQLDNLDDQMVKIENLSMKAEDKLSKMVSKLTEEEQEKFYN